jgi:hypothetical protein
MPFTAGPKRPGQPPGYRLRTGFQFGGFFLATHFAQQRRNIFQHFCQTGVVAGDSFREFQRLSEMPLGLFELSRIECVDAGLRGSLPNVHLGQGRRPGTTAQTRPAGQD